MLVMTDLFLHDVIIRMVMIEFGSVLTVFW